MDKLVLSFLVFSVIAIGFVSYANADEPDFGDVESDCYQQFNTTVITNDGNYTRHQMFCFWEINEFTNASASQNLTSVEQTALDLLVEKRESGESDIQIDLSYLDETFTPPTIIGRDVIPESCTRHNPSPGDIEECNIDSKMGFCERGIQSTSVFQQYEYFAVSEYIPRDDLQIDLNNGSKPIVGKLKEYEECRAELRLIIDSNKTHYVGMAKARENGEYNPYHRDFVTTGLTFPVPKLVDGMLVSEGLRADNKLCKMPYGEKYLADIGCPAPEYEGTYKNNTGITAYEARLKNTGPLANYYEYMETEGIGYYPGWIKKHSVTITGMSPGAQLEIKIPRE